MMDQMVQRESDISIDLESGGTTSEEEGNKDSVSGVRQAKTYLVRASSGVINFDGLIKDEDDSRSSSSANSFCENGELYLDKYSGGEENVALLGDKLLRETRRKLGMKKPPKPPRPPGGPMLDAADQKLVREISELAMLKRARRERMKAQKKLKAEKASQSSSSSSLCAMLVTIIFCLIIIYQGIFSSGRSHASFDISPESSAEAVISVQYYKKPSETSKPPASVSPNSVEQVSGSGPEEERRE